MGDIFMELFSPTYSSSLVLAAQLEPPVKSDDDRKPRTPRQKLERKMKKLERRRKSGMEAFTILMAMNIAMAFTSYVLAFAPRHTLDFHRYGLSSDATHNPRVY